MLNPQLWVTEGEDWWPSGRSTQRQRESCESLIVRREGIRWVPAAERDHGGHHDSGGEGRRPQVHTGSAVRTIVYTTSDGSLDNAATRCATPTD
jgi:hypothetical protein